MKLETTNLKPASYLNGKKWHISTKVRNKTKMHIFPKSLVAEETCWAKETNLSSRLLRCLESAGRDTGKEGSSEEGGLEIYIENS